MTNLVVENAVQAIELIMRAKAGGVDEDEITELVFGDDFGVVFRLPRGYDSEIPAQFLDAYHKEGQKLLRIIALIENGRADIKSLTNEQLEQYRFSVKVSEGSSNLQDNAKDLLQNVFNEALGKMDGQQAMITILGLGVIVCTTWGFRSYIQSRKEIRLEEVASTERRQTIEAFSAAKSEDTETYRQVIAAMSQSGDIGNRAADAADEIQSNRLRAAAQTNETQVGDFTITQDEARELRSSSRRTATTIRVVKEMRVIDVNRGDPANTSVVLEDISSGDQWKVLYSDRLLGERVSPVVIDALTNRATAMFTLRQKELEGEVISVEIIDAQLPEPDAD